MTVSSTERGTLDMRTIMQSFSWIRYLGVQVPYTDVSTSEVQMVFLALGLVIS